MRKLMCGPTRFAIAAFALAGCVATAGAGTISDPALHVEVSSSLGSATFDVPVSSLQEFPAGSGSFRFLQLTPVSLTDTNNNNLIATLEQGVVVLDPSPVPARVGLNFTLRAGDASTSVIVRSAMLDSLTANPAFGEASAGMTLTDLGSNGASAVGSNPGGGSYLAQYNGHAPGGTTFLQGINMLSTSGTMVGSVDMPLSAIGGIVDDMSAQFAFTLSANDQVSGTSTYRITPEPASIALLGLAFVFVRRR